jgi:glycosyltransferase involved in cell wall biosynthesis
MNDDVTVVIPCFNYGRFLPDAVQSALSQRGGEPRVLVVDDGSTEPLTLRELDRLPASVELVRQPNAGVAAARNTGLRRVLTPYAIVLDADDRLTEDALSCLRGPLDADPALGFSFGAMRFFGEWEGLLRMPDYDPYGLLFRHTIGSTALMRSQLFEVVGGYDSRFTGYEDWDFWLAALSHGWAGQRVDAETVFYRRHGASRHFAARAAYRPTFRQLRSKHAVLYAPAGRRRLAADSRLGRGSRLVYRFWWGARPVPARLEIALHSLLWRTK